MFESTSVSHQGHPQLEDIPQGLLETSPPPPSSGAEGVSEPTDSLESLSSQQSEGDNIPTVGMTFTEVFVWILECAHALFFWIHDSLFMSFVPDSISEGSQENDLYAQSMLNQFFPEGEGAQPGTRDDLRQKLGLLDDAYLKKLTLDITQEEMNVDEFMAWLFPESSEHTKLYLLKLELLNRIS